MSMQEGQTKIQY